MALFRNPCRVQKTKVMCRVGDKIGERTKMYPHQINMRILCDECTTFAPATIAPMMNANVKRNPNPNPNPNLKFYPTSTPKPNRYPHSNSLLSEISSCREQLSPEQIVGSFLGVGVYVCACVALSIIMFVNMYHL